MRSEDGDGQKPVEDSILSQNTILSFQLINVVSDKPSVSDFIIVDREMSFSHYWDDFFTEFTKTLCLILRLFLYW